jgi:GTP-binding protein
MSKKANNPATQQNTSYPAAGNGLPLVAIVGRPNVGKSTLFNRITGSRRSIVGDEPGITRDRIYGEVVWGGRRIRMVDTGGVVPDDPDLIPAEINNQARMALSEADVIVLVIDARTELASPDMDLARILIRGGKPVILAANKTEGAALEAAAENLRQLGFKNILPISAEHGQGIGDLLDMMVELLPAVTEVELTERAEADAEAEPEFDEAGEEINPVHRTHGEFEQHEVKIAIIGRPNVGKSTLLNALTGTERAIVSPIAGTTRDAVDETMEYNDQTFRFVDTAGIRRKGKTHLMAEKLSVVMARRHLEAADVSILVIDATEGVTGADATIGGYAHESGRSVVIAINKWDLVTTNRADGKPPADPIVYEQQLRRILKYLDYAPVVFISAAKKQNIPRLLQEVAEVAFERRKRVTTGQMNRFLADVDFQRAPVPMAKRIRIFFMTQAAVAPPTFVLFTDRKIKLHFAFERFLENQIRNSFGFKGTPIWFKVKARNESKKD